MDIIANIDFTSTAAIMAAIAFAANIGSSILKRWVYPKLGSLGVHATTFILAGIGAWVFLFGRDIDGLWPLLKQAFQVFTLAVVFYELALKRLDIFKVTTPEVEAARRG